MSCGVQNDDDVYLYSFDKIKQNRELKFSPAWSIDRFKLDDWFIDKKIPEYIIIGLNLPRLKKFSTLFVNIEEIFERHNIQEVEAQFIKKIIETD